MYSMDERLRQRLTEILERPVKWDCPLCDYTSFRIGGPADAVVSTGNLQELQDLLAALASSGVEWRVIGRGTNLLADDSGYRGVAILLDGKFKEIEIVEGETVSITAGAGLSLSRLSALCIDKGFAGLEFSAGIPGTVGGAVAMNAGAWGGEIGDVIVSVNTLSSAGLESLSKDKLSFGYRKTEGIDYGISVVTSAEFNLKAGDAEEIKRICRRHRKSRDEKQPKGFANAGSVFKNPKGDSAGRLIEACGLKGKRIGGALVSEKHANFIVNCGDASAADVLHLIEYVRKKVQQDSGVLLEPEVHVLC